VAQVTKLKESRRELKKQCRRAFRHTAVEFKKAKRALIALRELGNLSGSAGPPSEEESLSPEPASPPPKRHAGASSKHQEALIEMQEEPSGEQWIAFKEDFMEEALGFNPFAPLLKEDQVDHIAYQLLIKRMLGILRHSNPFSVGPLWDYYAPINKLYKVTRSAFRGQDFEPPYKELVLHVIRAAVSQDGKPLFEMFVSPTKEGANTFSTWVRASPLAGNHSIAQDGGKMPAASKWSIKSSWGTAPTSSWEAGAGGTDTATFVWKAGGGGTDPWATYKGRTQ